MEDSSVEDSSVEDSRESWPVAATEPLLKHWLISVRTDKVQMPDQNYAERTVVSHPGAVAVLALDEANRVLMIRQYRHPVGYQLWEIPAGLRDKPGEPLLAAAERELLEETGYRATDWRVLGDFFTSPGFSTERIRIFLARGLSRAPERELKYVRQDEEAQLLLAWVPLEKALAAFLAGDLHNGVAALGILSAAAARKAGFAALRLADAPEG